MAKIELHKVVARDKLAPRRDPYFQRLATGQYLGFRKMTPDSPGNWLVRYRDTAAGKQVSRPLGTFESLPASQRFDLAKKAAAQWLAHLERGGSTEVQTVAQACRAYADHIAGTGGEVKADDMRARYRRWIDADPLGSIDLDKLKREHVRAWRKRLESAQITTKGETRQRSDSANNRDMTALRAALNHMLTEGLVSSDFAWSEPLKPVTNADGRRTLYLSRDQRRELIAQAAPDAALFIRGLCALPVRPGALAELTVGDFSRSHGTLRVDSDKAGAGRAIKLPRAAASLLAECCRDKLPTAPLFARADGSKWSKDTWKSPIKDAVRAAGLDDSASAYTLRHSTITDLVSGGLDLASVATLAGTSVPMIAKHYAHLQHDRAADALAGLAL
jgi:site-specific recombinase XerD